MFTVQLLSNNTVHIESLNTSNRYGPKGKVIFICNEITAIQIKRENS